MNNLKLTLSLIFLFINLAGYTQITLNPEIESQGAHNLIMKQVEITKNNTIISFVYTSRFSGNISPLLMQPGNNGWVSIQPEIQIIGVGGKRNFKMVKTEGIPVEPEKHYLSFKNEKIFFKVYFQKLDPGIEKFDLFECVSGDRIICFNFYGVKVTNPEDKISALSKPTVIVSGKLLNSITKKPIGGKIIFEILPGEKIIGTSTSDPVTGAFSFSFKPSKSVYSYLATAKGFLGNQENIDLSQLTQSQTINKNIFLKPLEAGETINLKDIFFGQGEYVLLSSSFAELDKLVKVMQENPTMEIELEGHTDIIGNADDNMKLSENRVNAVKQYLVNKGIADKRLKTKAYGGTKPLKTDGTDEERQVNRRVEFKILKK